MPELKTKKEQIYEAAARSFRDKGFAATSMRDLAREVGLTASSLYNHIASKEEILQEICFRNARRYLEELDAVEKMTGNSIEKVQALLHLHIRLATEDVTSITAFNDEWRHLSEPYLSDFKQLRRDYENRFKTILREGMAAGELKPLDESIALYTLLSSIRWLYDWYRPGRSMRTEVLERDLVDMLMRGLTLNPARSD